MFLKPFFHISDGITLHRSVNEFFRRKNKLPHKKFNPNQTSLSQLFNQNIDLQNIPLKTMKVTIYALRWIFLLIFLFIIVGIVLLFVTGGQSYIQAIVGYSITGFFTFFMGYFGWILAQGIIEMITGKEPKEEKTYSYFFSKKDHYRF
jgi:hypothetical protein